MPKKAVDVRTALGGGYVKPTRVAWPQRLRWSSEEPTLFSPTDWMPQLAGSEEQGTEEPVHWLSEVKADVSTIDDIRLRNAHAHWYSGNSYVSVPAKEVLDGNYLIERIDGTTVYVRPSTSVNAQYVSVKNRLLLNNEAIWLV